MIELFKYTNINDYPISLVDNFSNHPLALQILFIYKMDGNF